MVDTCIMRWLVVASLMVLMTHMGKAGLVMSGGGVYKVILGYAIPVDVPSPMSVNYIHNFQFQYTAVDNASQVSVVQTGQRSNRQKRAVTRKQIYQVIEQMLDRKGLDRSCLLRSVCEVSGTPIIHSGVVGELLQTLLTPYDPDEDSDYSRAWRAGHQGRDCNTLFSTCPVGHSILDHISRYHD